MYLFLHEMTFRTVLLSPINNTDGGMIVRFLAGCLLREVIANAGLL